MLGVVTACCGSGSQEILSLAGLASLEITNDQGLVEGEAVNARLLALDCEQAWNGLRKLAAEEVQEAGIALREIRIGGQVFSQKVALFDCFARQLPIGRAESSADFLPTEQAVVYILEIPGAVLGHRVLRDFEEFAGFFVMILFQQQLGDGSGHRATRAFEGF